jgi:pimeloyl-ACP methyl ester carboxylesterase/class 3 adenylate cyclase
MTFPPQTRFTQQGEITLAYQVLGDGPIDLVLVPGFVSHLEYGWEEPAYARFLQRLASFSRLILFDKRGTGLSDRITGVATLEQRMDDVRAVMDSVNSQRAVLLGVSEGGAMTALFAATYPERTAALILYGSIVKSAWEPDYPWGDTMELLEQRSEKYRREWGGPVDIERFAPSMQDDERFRAWWAKYLRLGASPSAVRLNRLNNMEIDIRDILPVIHVPTLIINRTEDQVTFIEEGRYLHDHIPGSKLVELSGADHFYWVGDSETVINEIQAFVTGKTPAVEPDRVLATVLFTDIVDSTRRLVELGDRRWRDLLANHNLIVSREISRYNGREIENTGDGVLAAFDGPTRAIQCAFAIREALRQMRIEIRAGLHTGEIELLGERVSGVAVHLAARVMAKAPASEVWVTRTVKDLVVGSGFQFTESGLYELKGIPDAWRLYRVEG